MLAEIEYYGLAEVWESTFSESERISIEKRYRPLGFSVDGQDSKILSSSQSKIGFLYGLLGWFSSPDFSDISRKLTEIASKSIDSSTDIQDLHFLYQTQIQSNYSSRNVDPLALDRAKAACYAQIAISEGAARSFREEWGSARLPSHVGYTQLAIILEKEKSFQEAIDMCNRAFEQGWKGDWKLRTEKLKTKLEKLGIQ